LFGLASGVWLVVFHIAVGLFSILFVRKYQGTWKEALIITGLSEVFVITVFDVLLKVFWPTPALFQPLGIEWF